MARGIRFSATKLNNTIKKGNIVLAVERTVDYGPTQTTGFYTPVPPPTGGFTIYKNKASGGPSIFTAATDAQVIAAARSLGATGTIQTAADAFVWFAQQSDVVVVSDRSHDLITNGLVIFLDSTRRNSYPGSGNIWYDLSGNGNNFTLYNSPDYVSGALRFDGVSDYAELANNSTLDFSQGQTLMFWINHSITNGRRNLWDQAYGGYGTLTHESGGPFNYYYGDAARNATPYNGFTGPTIPRDSYQFITITRNLTQVKWYLNGVLSNTQNHAFADLAKDLNRIRIGSGYAGLWAGLVGQVYAYSRELSSTEVDFMYKATQPKFA